MIQESAPRETQKKDAVIDLEFDEIFGCTEEIEETEEVQLKREKLLTKLHILKPFMVGGFAFIAASWLFLIFAYGAVNGDENAPLFRLSLYFVEAGCIIGFILVTIRMRILYKIDKINNLE